MANTKNSKPTINQQKKYDASRMHDRRWPSDWPGEDPEFKTIATDKSYQEIVNYLKGPSIKNPPDELKEESSKKLKLMRKALFDNISTTENKWFPLVWYGTWEQLIQVVDWCQENHFLYFSDSESKVKWMQFNFYEGSNMEWIHQPSEIKTIWRGNLASLVEFFQLLSNSGAINDPVIRDWVADHFRYLIRGEFRGINVYSLRVFWSTIKSASKAGGGKALTAEQRSSLKKILKVIKLAK